MSKVRELAEKLFRADHPRAMPHSPWDRVVRLDDLWPADRERYIKMAEAVLCRDSDEQTQES
jgi:hypothetical protein